MTKKTSVKKLKRGDGGGVGSLMLAFVAFIFGYLVATIFDINQMHTWVNNKIQTESKAISQTKVAKNRTRPKLEFYTLLAQDNHKDRLRVVPNPTVAEPEPPKDLKTSTKVLPVPGTLAENKTSVVPPVTNLSKYVLQVGSFKRRDEAERMRANLVIKGFDVIIASVSQQNENWFRVMVGPVVSLKEAESLKSNLASRERINGMIRKVDA